LRNRVLRVLLDGQLDHQGDGITVEELTERLGS
jgi:hypothetical protein